MKYLVTCVPGMQGFVGELLTKEKNSKVKIILLENSLVLFESLLGLDEIAQIPYINNAYSVIHQFNGGDIESNIRILLNNPKYTKEICRSIHQKTRTFRIVLSDQGQLVSVNKNLMTKLYDKIKKETKLAIRVRGADAELWLMKRENGQVFFCWRITKRTATERDLNKGELRPEVTNLLYKLSEPKEDDIFLDPFSGTGAIPISRSKTPYNMIFAFDNDENKISEIKSSYKKILKLKKRKYGPFIVRVENACSLKSIDDGFITKIVTDPPWGIFDTTIPDLGKFYEVMLKELVRITKHGGILIFLLARSNETDQLIFLAKKMKIYNKEYNILLSGKKAVILKLVR